jgi:hypothetical protein
MQLRLVRLTGADFGLKNLGILLSPSCRRDSITPEEVASLISSSGEIRVAKKVCGVAADHVRGITPDSFSGYFIPYAQSLWSTVQSVHELIYLTSRHQRTFWR